MDKETAVKNLLASSRRLAEMDPQDEAVARTVAEMSEHTKLLGELARDDKSSPWGAQSMKDDIDAIGDQIKRLKAAAAIPAANYRRMFDILSSMEQVWAVAARPQNAAVRPKVAAMMKRVAGVFAEVDTVQDLDKPLDAIEKAIHSLYGDQSKNSTFYFDRRGKGHHKGE
jgi:hypothetical protein